MKKTVVSITLLILILFILVIGLGSALAPLVIAFFLAYLLFPIVKKIEAKGVKRVYAVACVFLSALFISILALFLIIPGLVEDGTTFLKELPQTSERAIDKIEFIASELGTPLDLSKQGIKVFVSKHISGVSKNMLTLLSKSLTLTFKNVLGAILAILNIFLIPLFFFYVVSDYEKISDGIKSYIPRSMLLSTATYSKLCNTVLSGYIRGQLMVAFILGILYGTGLTIVGLKFGFLIGFIAGIISVIPYAGFAFGFVAALTVSLAHYNGMGTIIGIVVVFTVVQILEGFLITPKLVGNKVGLSSFTTLLVLIIGGNLFGLLGMVIAIPMAAIGKTVIIELKSEYQASSLYK